jgi:hypothetical protein
MALNTLWSSCQRVLANLQEIFRKVAPLTNKRATLLQYAEDLKSEIANSLKIIFKIIIVSSPFSVLSNSVTCSSSQSRETVPFIPQEKNPWNIVGHVHTFLMYFATQHNVSDSSVYIPL